MVAGIEGLKIGEVNALDRPAAVRGAFQVGIMDQDRDPIPCDVNITFDHVRPVVEAPLKSLQCVLGSDSRRAAVPENQGGGRIEVGVGHGG
jgi:hypothetical protein